MCICAYVCIYLNCNVTLFEDLKHHLRPGDGPVAAKPWVALLV